MIAAIGLTIALMVQPAAPRYAVVQDGEVATLATEPPTEG